MSSSVMKNACKACRQRKVKCNRADPCSTCIRTGVSCVFPDRAKLPRGLNGGRRKEEREWRARLTKMEDLIESLQRKMSHDASKTLASPLDSNSMSPLSVQESHRCDNYLDRYLGSSLWTLLSDEVDGLREALENSSDVETDTDDDDAADQIHLAGTEQVRSDFSFVLSNGPNLVLNDQAVLHHPPAVCRRLLFSTYVANVDIVFKLIHRPTLEKHLDLLNSDPWYRDPAMDTLLFATYYASIVSLGQEDCLRMFKEGKGILLDRYRFATEVFLSRADFLNSDNLSTLQAFIIYLAVSRTHDYGKRQWALIAAALQLARSLGLHHDDTKSRMTFYERELRHRLWYQLAVIEFRASMDRGSETLIPPRSFTTPAPLNIEDEDFNWDDVKVPNQRAGFTSSTFTLLCHKCLEVKKQLNYSYGGHYNRALREDDWSERQKCADKFALVVNRDILPHCDERIPFHCHTKNVATLLMSTFNLLVIRPLTHHAKERPPSFSNTNSSALELAIDVLQREEAGLNSPQTRGWQWFLWVQWHILAVALTEMCGQPETALVQKAWPIVEKAFTRQAEVIADSKTGRLWQPMKILMKKARSMRRDQVDALGGGTNPLATFSPMQRVPEPVLDMNNAMEIAVLPSVSDTPFYQPQFGWDWWEAFVRDFSQYDPSSLYGMDIQG